VFDAAAVWKVIKEPLAGPCMFIPPQDFDVSYQSPSTISLWVDNCKLVLSKLIKAALAVPEVLSNCICGPPELEVSICKILSGEPVPIPTFPPTVAVIIFDKGTSVPTANF